MEKGKRKKGEIAGEVIIYILAVIIFGLIILFGYSEISKLMQKQKDIDLINFEKELKNVVEELSSSYGDVKDFRNAPLKVPGDYNKLCFIDLSKDADDDVNAYSLIMNSWNDKINANIFLVKSDMEYSFYANNITITAKSSLCFEIKNGKVNDLRIEGVGGSAKISKT